jgi:hypothetical protein
MGDEFEANTIGTPSPHEHVIFTDLDGAEGVLVDLNTRKYYQLNETAMLVWRGLEQHKPVENIVQELNDLYEVSAAAAAASVQRMLRSFSDYKLIHLR